jgi:hypothetical protein
VTPAWLTQVLRDGGHLTTDRVHAVTVTGIHDEQETSISYFLTADYGSAARGDLPTRLFLKLPRHALDPAAAEREVGMYRLFADHQHALPVVRCYSAAYDPTTQRYHVLLEDLSATHDQPPWHLDIADHYIQQTIDCLAQFHAYWWQHPSLPHLRASVLPQHDDRAELAAMRAALPTFLNTLGDTLTAADRDLYNRTLRSLTQLWSVPTEQPEHTLVHGDAHFWNFLYPLNHATHQTRIIDWQCVHVGLGLEDVTYAIILRYPRRIAANEDDLVRRYHAQLVAAGVKGCDWDKCWAAYRRAATLHVLSPIRFMLGGLPEAFWRMFVPRTLAAVRDLDLSPDAASA